jgi:uncharacterized RDD family membrane protein YckC
MSELQQNPFAPPRAEIADHHEPSGELVLAERGKRLAAFAVDMAPALVIGVLALVAGLWAGFSSVNASSAIFVPRFLAVAAVVFVAAVAWGVYNIVLVYRYGQTFGKKVMGIRMVRSDGSRMSFARFFFLRGLVMSLLSAIPFLGWPIQLVDKLLIFRDSHQCLHDNIADTLVVTAESSPTATLAGSRGEHLRTFQA